MQIQKHKLLLVDTDEAYGGEFVQTAMGEGLIVDHYCSILDMGYLGKLNYYDVVIVNLDLQNLSGLEVAHYVETLFSQLPLILIGGGVSDHRDAWPKSVFEYVPKSRGIKAILKSAQRALDHNPRISAQPMELLKHRREG